MKVYPMIEEEEEEEYPSIPEVRCEVVVFLLSRYGPATKGEISEALGWNQRWAEQALRTLKRQGRAYPKRLGKQGRHYVWSFIDVPNVMFG